MTSYVWLPRTTTSSATTSTPAVATVPAIADGVVCFGSDEGYTAWENYQETWAKRDEELQDICPKTVTSASRTRTPMWPWSIGSTWLTSLGWSGQGYEA
jgi:hypothetical protein